jgi:hypothetical protein
VNIVKDDKGAGPTPRTHSLSVAAGRVESVCPLSLYPAVLLRRTSGEGSYHFSQTGERSGEVRGGQGRRRSGGVSTWVTDGGHRTAVKRGGPRLGRGCHRWCGDGRTHSRRGQRRGTCRFGGRRRTRSGRDGQRSLFGTRRGHGLQHSRHVLSAQFHFVQIVFAQPLHIRNRIHRILRERSRNGLHIAGVQRRRIGGEEVADRSARPTCAQQKPACEHSEMDARVEDRETGRQCECERMRPTGESSFLL